MKVIDPPLALIVVQSTGTRRSPAFLSMRDGSCRFDPESEFPTYPKSERGEQLREQRLDSGLYLRVAAEALGLHAVDLSGLEWGRLTLSPEDWDRAIAHLRSLGGAR